MSRTEEEMRKEQGHEQKTWGQDFATSDPSLYPPSMLMQTTDPSHLSQVTSAYFDLADQTLRSARRVAEVAAIQGIRQQIVAEVSAQVLATLRAQQLV